MQITPLVRAVVAGWYFALLGALLGGTIALGLSALTTPQYRATTKLWVSVSGQAESSALEIAQGTNAAQQRIRSYIDLVGQPIVLAPVIAELSLDQSTQSLAGAVAATTPNGSVVLQISVTDARAEQAARIAEAVTKSFTSVVQDQLDRDTSGARVTITQTTPPSVPTTPVTPRTTANIALGVVAGFGLGVLGALLRWVLDTKVRGRADVQEHWNLPILGDIGHDQDAAKRPLILRDERSSQRAEAFRVLRTNVQFLSGRSAGAQSLAVTSSRPSEGKTTTTANLAMALAENGQRTLVIDADLRRPNLANVLAIEGSAGLSDLLVGRVEIDDVVQQWGSDELHVLPAGTIPPNPSELLGSAAMRALFDDAAERYDVILVDTPPLTSVTDAALIAGLVSNMLLVVAAGKVRRAEVSASIDALAAVGATAKGAIITMSRTRKRTGYYQYAYAAATGPVETDNAGRRAERAA